MVKIRNFDGPASSNVMMKAYQRGSDRPELSLDEKRKEEECFSMGHHSFRESRLRTQLTFP
jgi:hypothetical protein